MDGVVLLTQRVTIDPKTGARHDSIDQRYVEYVLDMGYTPFLVPNIPENIKLIISSFEILGIFLTGGNDLSSYGGQAPERDLTEEILIKHGVNKNIPILGVCRGMQVIGHYLIKTALLPCKNHVQRRHYVSGVINKEVNSFHNWALEEFENEDYRILAESEDGSIEAISNKIKPIIGIMWHPEREIKIDKEEQEMFKHFFKMGTINT